MAKNNIKLLSKTQFERINSKYTFTIEDDKIIVGLTTCARKTAHDIDKPFHINAKKIRKVCFSIEAINIWRELYHDGLPTLLQVQQAVNKLTITFQKVNTENVRKILSGQDIRIKRI